MTESFIVSFTALGDLCLTPMDITYLKNFNFFIIFVITYVSCFGIKMSAFHPRSVMGVNISGNEEKGVRKFYLNTITVNIRNIFF
jgi:hypothetical protein